jgi:hypothetical protein
MNSLHDIKEIQIYLSKYLIKDILELVIQYIPVFYNDIKYLNDKPLLTLKLKRLNKDNIISFSDYFFTIWNTTQNKTVEMFNSRRIEIIEPLDDENILLYSKFNYFRTINYKTNKVISLSSIFSRMWYCNCIKILNKNNILCSINDTIFYVDIKNNKIIDKFTKYYFRYTNCIEKISDSIIAFGTTKGRLNMWNTNTKEIYYTLDFKESITQIIKINNTSFLISTFENVIILSSDNYKILNRFSINYLIKEVLIYDEDTLLILYESDTVSTIILWNYKTNMTKQLDFNTNITSTIILDDKRILCGADRIKLISIK